MTTYSLSEHCRVALLQHFLELIVGGRASSDLQLSLYPTFAPVPVVGLRAVVLCHHFDELARQRRVLCLSYPQVRRRFVRMLFLFDVLLYVC